MPDYPTDNPPEPPNPEWPAAFSPQEGEIEPVDGAIPKRCAGSSVLTPLAWVVIVLVVLVLAVGANLPVAPEAPGTEDPLADMMMAIYGRYLVGAAELAGGEQLYAETDKSLNIGTIGQRQRFVVLAAELASPEEARKKLDQLNLEIAAELARAEEESAIDYAPGGESEPAPEEVDAGASPDLEEVEDKTADRFELSEEQMGVQRILGLLYPERPVEDLLEDLDILEEEDSSSSSTAPEIPAPEAQVDESVYLPTIAAAEALSADDRELLTERLGWFGELSLAPRGTPDVAARDALMKRATLTMGTMLGAAIGGISVGSLGFIGLIIMIVLLCIGRLKSGIARGQWHPGVYAETFAVWLLVFVVLLEVSGWAAIKFGGPALLMSAVAFFLSLVAIVWPVMRGVPWSQVRSDIGWTGGRQPMFEPGLGIACYSIALPILAIGIMLTFVLLLISGAMAGASQPFTPAGGPAHPIIVELGKGNLLVILQVLLVGSVAAPIVEETMFRGVLYRSLRDSTARFAPALSVIFSATISGFIFAAIHPQGWVAIPALMSLGIAFALAREWRGTLIVPMLMHAISNGLMLGIMSLLASL